MYFSGEVPMLEKSGAGHQNKKLFWKQIYDV